MRHTGNDLYSDYEALKFIVYAVHYGNPSLPGQVCPRIAHSSS